MVETLSPPNEKDEQEEMINTARKYTNAGPEKVTVTTEPGSKLMKVQGISAYMQVPCSEPKYEKGKTYTLELEPGEKIHRLESVRSEIYTGRIYASVLREIQEKNKEAKIINMKPLDSSPDNQINIEITTKQTGYVIQPVGAPTLNRKGAANLIGISPLWVYKLIERGPFDPNGGLMGYAMSPTGDGWIPRRAHGKAHHGSEMFLYKRDVEEYINAYTSTNEDEELRKMSIHPGLRQLFTRLALPELQQVGFVTMTSIWSQAKYETSRLSLDELEKMGLLKKLTDRDYSLLRATALQEDWQPNPRRSANSIKSSYRRSYRVLKEIE